MDFAKKYAELNADQKRAVDTIDGPLMVIAGPGTGKTQLLSMRVANILRKTDVNANNILCLTFTESGATNMTERMALLFGPDAYRVAVHTFHSFGSEVINHNGQYFYEGAYFHAADDLTSNEVLEEILETLPHSSPLASRMNGQFTYLNDLASGISALKKSGLAPGEVSQVLEQNLKFCDFANPILRTVFADRIGKKTLDSAMAALSQITDYSETTLDFATEPPLSRIVCESLRRAINESEMSGKTKSLTSWKKDWLRKNADENLVLADQLSSEKLTEVAKIYDAYLRKMTEKSLYDFDDMILRVTHALEIFPELKYDLQEKFQYILVDEFQDTNDAQMRLLRSLTDYDSRPNIMVVGDDDQAIFRFQGADISNIQSFSQSYTDVAKVVLTENYRSAESILEVAGKVASQAEERLANIENVDKTLHANASSNGAKVEHLVAKNAESEFSFIAKHIADQITDGAAPDSIAVISRRHADLAKLLPFMTQAKIDVEYEREQDVLASAPVEQLEFTARIVHYLSVAMHAEADELLPRILAHPAWGVTPQEIWELSLEAKSKRKYWLEIMLSFNDRTAEIAEWLIMMSAKSQNETLEVMLDELFGRVDQIPNDDQQDEPFGADSPEFVSPLRNHFFSETLLAKNPTSYLEFLSDLTTLRRKLREYRPDQRLLLEDFVTLIDTYRDLGKSIRATRKFQTGARVQLLTAHKAKGLEFDTVYVINASSQNWGDKSRSRGSLIKFPHNMPFVLGDSNDEKIRLLFVALTRAKRQLFLTMHESGENGRELLPVEYLLSDRLSQRELPAPTTAETMRNIETAWHAPIVEIAGDLRELLADTLAHYKLSATHLNNFVDVANGGPAKFLLQNLLRFPQAKSPAAVFGTAAHTTLQRAHLHLSAKGTNKPLEDILGDFATVLAGESMTDRDYEFYHQKGVDALTAFYDQRIDSFSSEQIVERSFGSQNIIVDGARLSGAIDLIDIDHDAKTIRVTDYKTGKAAKSWRGATDYEKTKLRKYRQQLMFYKLLLENSREFGNYTVTTGILEFVEPANGRIVQLEMNYGESELADFRKLIASVWNHIMTLNLPEITEFSADSQGMEAFEQKLCEDI